MIVFLEGKIVRKSVTQVWMNVQGVGYELQITLPTYEQIQNWDNGLLYVYHQWKEDGESLFGFFDLYEREIFMHLISVSGVGASTARVMLSSMKAEDLRLAIVQGNEKLLESVKGIGAKTAKRIILELKDKMLKSGESISPSQTSDNNLANDALVALVSLGIARNMAFQAVQKVIKTEKVNQVEEIIKLALKML